MKVCNCFIGPLVIRVAGICAMKAPTNGAAAATAATAAQNPCEGQLSVCLSESISSGSEMRSFCHFFRLRFLRSDFVGLPCLRIKAQVFFFYFFSSYRFLVVFTPKLGLGIFIHNRLVRLQNTAFPAFSREPNKWRPCIYTCVKLFLTNGLNDTCCSRREKEHQPRAMAGVRRTSSELAAGGDARRLFSTRPQ